MQMLLEWMRDKMISWLEGWISWEMAVFLILAVSIFVLFFWKSGRQAVRNLILLVLKCMRDEIIGYLKSRIFWELTIFLILVVSIFAFFFWKPKDQEIIRNLILLVAGVVGWYFLARRTRAAEREASISEQRIKNEEKDKISEQISRAKEQLDEDEFSERLSGVDQLKRIAESHEGERENIAQILSVFVRDFAPGKSDTRTLKKDDTRITGKDMRAFGKNRDARDKENNNYLDIEEAVKLLTVIAKSFSEREKIIFCDLRSTNLSGLSFYNIDLSHFNLLDVNFSNSLLWWVDFTGARLGKVNFSGVSLRYSKGLTKEQLEKAFYWKGEQPEEFPEDLLRNLLEIEKPVEWEKPTRPETCISLATGDKWEIYKDRADEWRWRRTARNGEIVGSSNEGYKDKADCIVNAKRCGMDCNPF